MNSKELIKKIDIGRVGNGTQTYNDMCLILNKEETLEHLQYIEKLEKENKELHNQIISLELDTCIPDLRKENQELKEEKDKLKQEIDVMRENVKTFQNWNNSLFNTKEKLKKALEGLNECFDFEIDEETETIYCCLGDVTGIDIEFLRELKEVLQDD